MMDLSSDYQVLIDHKAKTEHVQMIQAGVIDYNQPFLGSKNPFCVFLKGKNDEILGGASGYVWHMHNMLFLDFVYIDKSLRGQGCGTRMMKEVEAEARRLGCTSIVLDTFSFQAEGFYSKLGFTRIGVIEKQIADYDRIYMRKTLD